MNNFEHAKNAMKGATVKDDLILRPDFLTPSDRLEALRAGGSPWEIEYWEGVEVEQIDRHRLGNVALNNLKINRIP